VSSLIVGIGKGWSSGRQSQQIIERKALQRLLAGSTGDATSMERRMLIESVGKYISTCYGASRVPLKM